MLQIIKRDSYFLGILIGIYYLAWMMQSQTLLNWDVSWLMQVAKRLLAGGNYTQDFFEINPPMILYLYIPPVIFAKYFVVSHIFALRCYMFSLASISIFICFFLCEKIFYAEDKGIARIFILSLATIYLILPVYEFGQREQLLLILILPYLLLVTCQLQGHQLKPHYTFIIGLLAGLGFALKPYFLITLILVEFYYMVNMRTVSACIRAELIAILLTLAIYVVSVFVFHHDYIDLVLLTARHFYYAGMMLSSSKILTFTPAIFCSIALLFYFTQFNHHRYKTLSLIIVLAIIGFYLSYFIPHTIWYYHIVPAFALAILLSVLLFCELGSQNSLSKPNYFMLFGLCAIVSCLLYFLSGQINTILVFNPILFYSFFAILFGLLFSIGKYKITVYKLIGSVAIIIIVSATFSNMVRQDSWYSYRFYLTLIFLVMMFGIFTTRYRNGKSDHIYLAVIGMLIFSFPVYYVYYCYQLALSNKDHMNKLIVFTREHAQHQSVYFFTTVANSAYPVVDYADAESASRVAFLGWIPGLIKQSTKRLDSQEQQQLNKDKNFFINMVSDDLIRKQPYLVFIDVNTTKSYLDAIPFNYLTYFSTNPQFQNAWKAYRYFTTIEASGIYKYQIYQRIK